jgi:hypothetical protein
MKKFFPLIIAVLVIQTSCIDIVEKITIHKNHSGNVRYSLETGKISSFLSGFTEFNGNPVTSNLEGQITGFVEKLRQIPGIDSVEYEIDTKTNEYYLRFSFASVKQLNNAVYTILDYKKNLFSPIFMKISSHNLRRKNFVPLLNKYIESQSVAVDSSFRDFANLISFKTIIQMPTLPKNVSGENCRITEDLGAVIQTHNVTGILENTANLGFRIRY